VDNMYVHADVCTHTDMHELAQYILLNVNIERKFKETNKMST